MADVCELIKGCISDGVTQTAIATEAGISGATLSAWLRGKYAGDSEQVAVRLSIWHENWQKKTALPEPPGFVVTETVRELRGLFQAVRLMGCINVILGVPGVGKTATARDYCSNPNTWLVTLSPAHSSVTECLLEMADALGLDSTPSSKGALSRAIRKRLAGTRGLLIVDEADHLAVDGLEQLRAIQDATGVGMVLIGNPRGLSRASRRGMDDLARLFSRIARARRLRGAKKADVGAIAEAWGISGDAEIAVMQAIAEKPGALRVLTHTLRQAWITAGGEGSPLTERHIKAAFKEVYSSPELMMRV